MGKLMVRLEKQLTTEYKKDAEECIEIYNWIKSTDKDGRVWSSRWESLVDVTFKGYPSDERRYYLNITGKTLLGKINTSVEEKMYSREKVIDFTYGAVKECMQMNDLEIDSWIKENL